MCGCGEKIPFAQVPEVQRAIEAAERELDGKGGASWCAIRGTEALARVMVEAESEERMLALAEGDCRGRFRRALGGVALDAPRCAGQDKRGCHSHTSAGGGVYRIGVFDPHPYCAAFR
jgi:hypothetical protein